jgi:hypothetical protein
MRRAFSSKSLRINFSLFRHSLKVRTSVFFLRRVRGHGIKEVVLFIFCDAEIVCRLFSRYLYHLAGVLVYLVAVALVSMLANQLARQQRNSSVSRMPVSPLP